MRSIQVALLTLVALVEVAVGGTGADTAAPPTGTVTLSGLPAGARVYVDGKAARPREGALRLAPGVHEMQVHDRRVSRQMKWRR
jgi:hypothetical protein